MGVKWIDAFFMATSAVCVTGLSLYDIGQEFSVFGQCIILLLIQFGGLGIMTFSTFFVLFLSGKMSLKSKLLIKETLIDTSDALNFKKLLMNIISYTLLFELIGAILFYLCLPFSKKGIFVSMFHSISAFCNAGFSLYSNSLEDFTHHSMLVCIVGTLIILGGLGAVVVRDLLGLYQKPFRLWWKSINLQTKVVLVTTSFLLIIGTIFFYAAERNGAMKDQSVKVKLTHAFFQSATTRTAGFNSLNMSELSDSSYIVTCGLMVIGGSPGSTAGGIKTTTFAILFAMFLMVVKNKRQVVIFQRSIMPQLVYRAATVVICAMGLILVVSCCLMLTENYESAIFVQRGKFLTLLFETCSAFGTVGLSSGITPSLSVSGKILITFLMYVGRVGPLTLAMIFATFEKPLNIGYPDGKLMIG